MILFSSAKYRSNHLDPTKGKHNTGESLLNGLIANNKMRQKLSFVSLCSLTSLRKIVHAFRFIVIHYIKEKDSKKVLGCLKFDTCFD